MLWTNWFRRGVGRDRDPPRPAERVSARVSSGYRLHIARFLNKWFNVPRVWRARPDMRSCLNHGACLGKSSRREGDAGAASDVEEELPFPRERDRRADVYKRIKQDLRKCELECVQSLLWKRIKNSIVQIAMLQCDLAREQKVGFRFELEEKAVIGRALQTIRDARDYRIIETDDVIEKKLQCELTCSKTEMNAESDNENWSSVLESADNGGVSGNERETPTVADFNISVASTQGKRTSMEDQHAADQLKCGEYTIPYFAVYDGHGGVEAAEYAKRKMPGIIAGTLQMHLQKRCSENTAQAMSKSDIWNALKLSFVKLNDAFNQEHPDLVTVGTTALFSLIIDGKLWTASAGDSRAVLLRSDETVALTSDAKPSVEKFKTSVEKRGGYITFGRVAHYNEMGVLIGGLAVARAIGDASAKGISARPKITCVDWRPTDTLILACDGPFEVGSRMQVAKCVRTHGKQNWQTAADAVIKNASCSKDNMTVMVIGQNQDASSLTQS